MLGEHHMGPFLTMFPSTREMRIGVSFTYLFAYQFCCFKIGAILDNVRFSPVLAGVDVRRREIWIHLL